MCTSTRLKKERERDKRRSCKTVGGDLQPRPCNLPSTWLDVLWVLQYQKRRQVYNTADRSPFMVDGQGCLEGGVVGCNKAECISPGMRLQWLGGGKKKRGKAGEVIQILACEWASAYVQYAPYVQMRMCLCCEEEAVCSGLLLMSVVWTITQLVQYEWY